MRSMSKQRKKNIAAYLDVLTSRFLQLKNGIN